MTLNRYHVPEATWAQWSPSARYVYNITYMRLSGAQSHVLHPSTPPMPHGEWLIIAAKVATLVAEAIAFSPVDAAAVERQALNALLVDEEAG